MARHIGFAKLTILAQERRADRIRGSTMEAAAESDHVRARGRHPGHAHGVLVRLSSRIAEEGLGQRLRSNRDQFLCGLCARLRINQIRIEEQLIGLMLDGIDDVRMTMPGAGHRVSAVKIKITFPIARIDPRAFAALRDDRHLLIGRELKLLLYRFHILHFDCSFCFHPALEPFGTSLSGIARAGKMPSAYPMSKSIPSENCPIILFGARLTTNSAWRPSISRGFSRSCFMPARIERW